MDYGQSYDLNLVISSVLVVPGLRVFSGSENVSICILNVSVKFYTINNCIRVVQSPSKDLTITKTVVINLVALKVHYMESLVKGDT